MYVKIKNFTRLYKKWFPHVGTFAVVKKKSSGELRLLIKNNSPWGDYSTVCDSKALDVFIWLGRYLALKGKLPRHLALEEIAVGAQRTSKAIREVIATEIYQSIPHPSVAEFVEKLTEKPARNKENV